MFKRLTRHVGHAGATHVGTLAPGATASLVHRALNASITGVGPLTGAQEYADSARAEEDDLERALDGVVSAHVKLAGLQGFCTNIGGLVTSAATIPANASGLALLHCRMVAAIAALGGHDLGDDGVRNAVLLCILGRDDVETLVEDGHLPGTPSRMARGDARATPEDLPDADLDVGSGATDLDRLVAAQVASALIANALGSSLSTTVGKRIPLIGGVIGAGTDAWATREVGAYAREELGPRPT